MKFFPDEEKKKRFMKNGLPVMFAVAWTPIIWMVLAAVLGPVLERVLPVWQLVVLIIAMLSVLAMVMLVRLFRILGLKFFGENG
ncbi:conserved hypothetical protein [Chlorobaculum parvum NCIB 8327]|uniref:Uncharacterized protein n=1 Tax=Chlorobaculum parvum (strain DSM 263 / NCIMB 8327) TaxID=517417 RepID=B3QP59_CHLP8|nr:hypothetical protein [Chlorobaculum parvum]ACF11712.1 conserved hypothetical protein [Chlorobaculum parvum NCIB 8327]